MKKFEKLGIMLSVVCAINLALGFGISQALTDVVWLQPQGNTSGEFTSDMGYVAQSFTATAETIRTASFFCGKERPSGNYYGYINTSPSPGGTSAYGSSAGKKYQDVVFTFNAPVTRGQRYYFVIQHTGGGSPQGLEYYYREGSAYLYGSLYVSGTQDTSHDLCARVVGTGKVIDVWGQNPYIVWGWWKGVATSDSTLDICQGEGVTYIREQIPWGLIQPTADTTDPAFDWTATDSMMKWASQRGMKVVWNSIQSPWWASTQPQPDTCIPPDAQIVNHPPKGLYLPVFVNGQINTQNPFGYYVWKVVKRYGNGGSNTYGNPVQYWEIWNEANSLSQWDYPDTTYNISYGDSLGLLRLYERLVEVAHEAIKGPYGADPQGKIVIAGLERVLVSGKYKSKCSPYDSIQGHPYLGKWWLDQFLADGGGQRIDVYGFHPYQNPWSKPPDGRVNMALFKRDTDTLWQVLTRHGQEGKPLWLNEIGWGASNVTLTREKQADNFVQMHAAVIERGANPGGTLDKLMWYQIRDEWSLNHTFTDSAHLWWGYAGTVDSTLTPKPMHYAAKQMNIKLKDKYFNRQVPLGNPTDSVYCFEFQIPGSDTCRKTWVVWKVSTPPVAESLPIRTGHADTIKIAYSSTVDSSEKFPGVSGYLKISIDTCPQYIQERYSDPLSRPDVIVDSVWLVKASGTGEPRAGEGVYIYARIKNIGNAALADSLGNAVTFQVDGVSKKTYTDQRGLGIGDTMTIGYFTGLGVADWVATWGDHLIRAWVDSSDRYVELREDNNCGYLFKHVSPKVSVLINNGNKFTNHFSNDTLNLVFNGGTSPQPDSMRVKNEGQWGTWIKPPVTTYVFNFDAGNGNGPRWDSVEIRQSGEADIGGDSIIVDASAPYTYITSPVDSQVVGLGQSVPFVGWSYDFEDHDSPWEIWEDFFPWASGNAKVGENPWFGMPDTFGFWNSYGVGWHTHSLVTNDSATNTDTAVVHVYVIDPTGDGDGFASGFGSFGSSPVNVATDPKGNVYIPETQGSMVRKYSPKKDTLFSFSAKRGQDTTGLAWPAAIVCAPETLSGRTTLYVADGYAHAIKRFDGQGNLLLRFGTFGSDSAGKFNQPSGIALDHKGRLFIVDRGNNRVQVYDTTGRFLFGFGGLGRDSGKMNSPTGIAITTKGQVFVTDTKNHQLQVFDSLGNWMKTIKKPDTLGFDTPTGICVDRHGNIFIADTKHNRIVELNPYGRRLFTFGSEGDSLWNFRSPVGVASSPGGHFLYVADLGNRRVTRFTVIRGDTTGGGPQAGAVVQPLPLVYELGPAIPNPSKGQTTFRYALPKESRVNMTFYNVAGQVVREFNQGKQKAGYYSLTWDGRSNLGHRVGAGIYFYRLEAGSWVKTRKMVVIR